MDFELTEEQRLIQETARDFAERELIPIAEKVDETREAPLDKVKMLGELGFLGMLVPEEYGGAGLDDVSYVLAMEEIARGCASTCVIMDVNNSLVCEPLRMFGNEEQKRRVLTPLARGERLGAYCLTEPDAGSDAGSVKTRAVLDGDDYILTGTKIFVTNGGFANTFIVFANSDPEKGSRGITAFIVEEERGVKRGTREKTLGIRASTTYEILFEEVRVPRANVLGEPGKGFKIAMEALDSGRIGIAAQAVGIARAAFERSVNHAKTRQQFGRPIGDFQAIQWKLADMAVQIEAAHLLTMRAAVLRDTGGDYVTASAMAKLYASRVAVETADAAIQVHGGYGYTQEYHVERHFRDAKITELYEGTSEIQRLIIARRLLRG
ncbi:MAG: acyl-CoA dehydrogenase [Candidatus Eisenbacteria bacterium]|uniref:Acyl-CoA dehydrogenase n=1 Tax=Eiseniibacteriota bacterium TaxID=2212470 RepID=A0A937X6M0_UNCEI|nr:acyl-CoA dehydrogenase [Candidatus Eisenbacteria bacterium]